MSKNVTIYSLSTCPHCINAKAYLKEKGVDFEDIDVGKDKEAAKKMIEISDSRSVPVIVIGKEIIVGFDAARIDGALDM